MAKVIVGIHGLANKPKRAVLKKYWIDSIKEGLRKNCNVRTPAFDYKMVYWADLLYHTQQHDDPLFSFDKLYNDEPYIDGGRGPSNFMRTASPIRSWPAYWACSGPASMSPRISSIWRGWPTGFWARS